MATSHPPRRPGAAPSRAKATHWLAGLAGKSYLTAMTTQTHLSAKGQVVIPKGLRDRLRWVPGMRFDIVERGGSVTLHPRVDAPAFAPSSLAALQALSPAAPAQPVAAISGLDDAMLARLLTDD